MAFPSQQSPQRHLHPPDLFTHLGKLRKALTCSVCNQIFKKPASLHCNHHFCMSCLVQSMEAMSACPKCKQPAVSRQVRLAPEMSKVVGIFQGLESSAGSIAAKDSEDSQLENVLDVRGVAHSVKLEEECVSPSASKRQKRQESKEQVLSTLRCATESDTRKRDASSLEIPCRGILPASKRIQLPCPPVPVSTAKVLSSSPEKADLASFKTTSSSPEKRKQSLRSGGQVPKHGAGFCEEGGKAQMPMAIKGSIWEREHSETSGRTNENDPLHSKAPMQDRKGVKSELQNKVVQGVHKHDAEKQASSACVPIADGSVRLNSEQGADFGGEKVTCAFCHKSDSEVAGPMIYYKNGVAVSGSKRAGQIFNVHKNCAEWAPGVYYEIDVAKNIPQEVARGQKMKCHVCGLRGAVLGCYVKRCRKSFHYPCAHTLACRWDDGNFLVFCPEHVTSRFPEEGSTSGGSKSVNACSLEEKSKQGIDSYRFGHQSYDAAALHEDAYRPGLPAEIETSDDEGPSKQWSCSNWVLCSSGLSPRGNELMATFANCTRLTVEKLWSSSVTHLIVGTDEIGAARRTFKYLMAVLEGRWILKIDWLSACMAANTFVSEEPYEVTIDIHGMIGGPRNARAMSASKVCGLFEGLSFYLLGEYVSSFKADLEALLLSGGGLVLKQVPESSENDSKSCIVLIYSKDMSVDANASHREEQNRSRCVEAKLLAGMTGAKVAGHTWILDSVAAYKLQPFE